MKAGCIAAASGLGLLALVVAPASITAATTEKDFALNTTQDLVDLCGAKPDDPMHDQARELCLGYIAGVAHMHRFLVAEKKLRGGPIACPERTVSRDVFAQEFVVWANAHTQYMGDPPVQAMARAAAEKYPCSKAGSSKR
jgi:hypothetical protein